MNEPYPVPGVEPQDVSLAGKLIPWDDEENQPILLRVPDSEEPYLVLFSGVESLRVFLGLLGVRVDRIKRVDDPVDFLSSLHPSIHVIVDPYFTLEGKVRFHEVLTPTISEA